VSRGSSKFPSRLGTDASLYMSMCRTAAPGIMVLIFSQKTVFPEPLGPARPTMMVPSIREERSWRALRGIGGRGGRG